MPTIKQYTHTASDCVFQVILDGEVVKEFLLKDLYVVDTAHGFILSDDLYSMTFDAANTLDITAPDIRDLREGCNGPITPTPPQQALKLTFDDIVNADSLVGGASDVANWNTFFDLPALGNPFTSVEIVGNEVKLYGGSGIKAKPALMYDQGKNYIIGIDDQASCITSVGGDAFSYCYELTSVNLPGCTIIYGYQDSPEGQYGGFGECINLTTLNLPSLETAGNTAFAYCTSLNSISLPSLITAGDSCFSDCTSLTLVDLPNLTTAGSGCFQICSSLTSIDLPNLTTAGTACFQISTSLTSIDLPNLTTAGASCFLSCTSLASVSIPSCIELGNTTGNNSVFNYISGNTISLTIPSALMTADSGNPDGDIQYLQANNTVAITTV